ncbi:MAG: AGE family epimerase/isomerase [Treponema sp.]|nr:AGE family epimerase/isomerase [Treponema sp.]
MLNKQEALQMIRNNILPFWQGMIDNSGGFYGEADFYGNINKTADRGCILNSRILWTFSAAYKVLGDVSCMLYAKHAYDILCGSFLDREHGGLYWLISHNGMPVNVRKQFYNIAFGIYALSEYYSASGDCGALKLAMTLFDAMEKHGLDKTQGGYIEACAQDWKIISDYRLSDKDLNCPKSMNTNLHALEAYTTLARANHDRRVTEALESLLHITLDKIVNRSRNFNLFFDMNWKPLSGDISYGHDIEGSWLLYEAALAIGNQNLIAKVKQTALEIAQGTYSDAIDSKNGGLFSSRSGEGVIHAKKEWWPQAEAVVGFYNAYELSAERKYLEAAENIWEYINEYFTDKKNGEWHNELNMDNSPDTNMPKAGFWKCPYHNGRMCLEIIRRLT